MLAWGALGLDDGKRLGVLPVGTYLDHNHGRKFGHHRERCRFLRLFLVPPRQRAPRRLHMDTQRPLHQAP